MIDLAAERAVLGALLTGALASRDVDADLFGHPHHARLCRLLMALRAKRKGPPPLALVDALCNRRRVWGFGFADGEPRIVPLVDLARSAPKRARALEALRVLRDAATVGDDVRRDREALVAVAAEMVDDVLHGYTRRVGADGGVVCRGGEDGAYLRPIEPDAVPTPRTFRREVWARLNAPPPERPRDVPEWLPPSPLGTHDPDSFVRERGADALRAIVAAFVPLE